MGEEDPEVQAVFLYDRRAKTTAKHRSDVGLALSMDGGPEETWRLAHFINHRRAWKSELETALLPTIDAEGRVDKTHQLVGTLLPVRLGDGRSKEPVTDWPVPKHGPRDHSAGTRTD